MVFDYTVKQLNGGDCMTFKEFMTVWSGIEDVTIVIQQKGKADLCTGGSGLTMMRMDTAYKYNVKLVTVPDKDTIKVYLEPIPEEEPDV